MTSPHPPSLELCYSRSGAVERRRFTGGSLTLGRDPGSDVVLADGSVSRQHARIDLEGGTWTVHDLASANGVTVHGKRVASHAIADGDTITLGNVAIQCRLPSPTEGLATGSLDGSTQGMTISSRAVDEILEEVYRAEAPSKAGARGPEASAAPAAESQRAPWVLPLLRDASDALLSNDDLDATLEVVMNLVFEHLPADRGQILLANGEGDALRPAARRSRSEAKDEASTYSRHIAESAIRDRRAVLVHDTRAEGFGSVESVVSNDIRSAMCAPLYHRSRVLGILWLDRTSERAASDSVFEATHLEVLTILASLAAAAVERAQLRDRIEAERRVRERLARYHAPAVVDEIIRLDRLGQELDATEREVTVLFCDITSFTPLSERLAPRQVITVLNRVFQTLTEEVFREAGTLDKFMGDAMMVFFGAPIEQPDHAVRAVRAALAMQERMAALAAENPWGTPVGVRIGINTGTAIVGDVGADDRKDYTVIGDTVNVASRLESSVAETGQVVIGPRTHELVAKHFDCEPLGERSLEGKQRRIAAWAVTRR